MTRTLAMTSLCGLLAAAGCGKPAEEAVETAASVPVTVQAARIDTLRTTIVVTGSIVPAPGADWTITAPEPARIAELPRAEGEAVREGDLLVRFDIPSLPAELAAKRAEVQQAQARLEVAKAEVTRTTDLLAQGVLARKEAEAAKREQTDAEAALAQANSALEAARQLADRAVVTARFAGTVAKRWHNPGDLVEAAASDPILRVIDPRRLQAVAAVPIPDLPRVVPGHRATVTGPAGATLDATVLTKPAQVDAGSATADVRLSLGASTRLAVGTALKVEILAEEHPQVVVIPMAAVVHDGDDTFVMVAGSDNKAHKHVVKLGLTSHEFAEVTSGVAAGDQVIVLGQDGLPDGAAITVQK